jgi:hypothetical protein
MKSPVKEIKDTHVPKTNSAAYPNGSFLENELERNDAMGRRRRPCRSGSITHEATTRISRGILCFPPTRVAGIRASRPLEWRWTVAHNGIPGKTYSMKSNTLCRKRGFLQGFLRGLNSQSEIFRSQKYASRTNRKLPFKPNSGPVRTCGQGTGRFASVSQHLARRFSGVPVPAHSQARRMRRKRARSDLG